jgi:hypothetical protein
VLGCASSFSLRNTFHSMAAKVMDLLRVGHRFNCFQEVEKLVLDLRQFGSPVRIASSCLIQDYNRVVRWRFIFLLLYVKLKFLRNVI